MFKDILTNPTLQSILIGQARHLLTLAGGSLVTAGVIQGGQVEAFAGIGMALLGFALSALAKKAAT